MQPLIIRDPARVRSYLVVMILSLVLLAGWVVVRRFVGPPEQIPPTMYAVVAAIVLAWNISGIMSRSDLLRIDSRGIASGREVFSWSQIRSAAADRGDLVVTAGRRHVLAVPAGREQEINSAITEHRRAAARHDDGPGR